MTDKFTEMATRVASAHAASNAEKKSKADAERAAKYARVDADIATLEGHVLPTLEAARAAFEAQGIQFVILKRYDVRDRAVYVSPAISFHGQTPQRKSDGWRGNARGVFFTADSNTITATSTKHGVSLDIVTNKGDGDMLGKAQPGGAEPMVTDCVEWALNAFHEDMKNQFAYVMDR